MKLQISDIYEDDNNEKDIFDIGCVFACEWC